MLTVSTAKTYLKITDTSSDALIAALIPIVYQDIVNECNNPMVDASTKVARSDIYFDAPDLIKLDAGGFDGLELEAGMYFAVSGSRLNDGLYQVAVVSDTSIETVAQTVSDEAKASREVTLAASLIPSAVDFVAARMIGYQIANVASAGVESMSLGNYSETRKTTQGGYPDEILNALRPWKNMTTGRGTVRWHINENRVWFPPWTPNVAGGE